MDLRCFATTLPGLGSVLAEEITASGGDAHPVEGDGRNDIVPFTAPPHGLLRLRCSEDVFASIGTARLDRGRQTTLDHLLDAAAIEQALSARSAVGRPVRNPIGIRTVVRLHDERLFRRTELRDALQRRLLTAHHRWRTADPADVEFWATESRPGRLRLGLRLSDATMRHRSGPSAARPGALRPTVAAAMVRLAGNPRGLLLDPCCGSGTILEEAMARGWTAAGSDIDAGAVHLVPRAGVQGATWVGDARRLPMRHGSVGAMVTNLPFGDRYRSLTSAELRALVREAARVLQARSPLVVLHGGGPALAQAAAGVGLRQRRRLQVVLLGHRAELLVLGSG